MNIKEAQTASNVGDISGIDDEVVDIDEELSSENEQNSYENENAGFAESNSYFVTELSVVSEDVISQGTDRDEDLVIVKAGEPVRFMIGTWPHEVSDETVYVDDEPVKGIELQEGTFTLPAEMIHDDFKVCVKAKTGDSELETEELYISAE